MSADLLRRAATRLRESALAATGGSWCSLDGGDRLVSFSEDGRTQLDYVVDEPMSNAANAAYIATVHPPVALALAELLDHVSDDYGDERAEEKDFPHVSGSTYKAVVDAYGGQRWDWTAALAVARAVLREPEGGETA